MDPRSIEYFVHNKHVADREILAALNEGQIARYTMRTADNTVGGACFNNAKHLVNQIDIRDLNGFEKLTPAEQDALIKNVYDAYLFDYLPDTNQIYINIITANEIIAIKNDTIKRKKIADNANVLMISPPLQAGFQMPDASMMTSPITLARYIAENNSTAKNASVWVYQHSSKVSTTALAIYEGKNALALKQDYLAVLATQLKCHYTQQVGFFKPASALAENPQATRRISENRQYRQYNQQCNVIRKP